MPLFIFIMNLNNFIKIKGGLQIILILNKNRYQNSISFGQISGKNVDIESLKTDCDPIVYNKDIFKSLNPKIFTFNTTVLDPEAIAYPCGLMAKSIFTDQYKVEFQNSLIPIDSKGIAWHDEVGGRIKFQDKQTAPQKFWYDIETDAFAIWVRPATFSTFRKLYGKINQKLEKGNYQIIITNYYDVSEFKGKKNFILTTMGPFGTRNQVLPISFLALGFILLLIAGAFFYKYKSTGGKFGGKFKVI